MFVPDSLRAVVSRVPVLGSDGDDFRPLGGSLGHNGGVGVLDEHGTVVIQVLNLEKKIIKCMKCLSMYI